MAEWSIALALKASVPQGTVGSNPTLSATITEEEESEYEESEYEESNY